MRAKPPSLANGSPTVTTADLVAGLPILLTAIVAVSSLVLAHAHHHSLSGVIALSLVVVVALATLVVRAYRGGRFEVTSDRGGVVAVLACAIVAVVMFIPGFSYGVSDKDPGGYVAHAVEIAHHGSYSFIDPALAHPGLPVALNSPGARLSAVWVRDEARGLIVPQFYHLWPALMATSYDIAGFGGITTTGPLVTVFAIMVLVGLLRRLAGLPAAVVGGILLATNMLEVWQAKFPTTEVFAQGLFVASLLGVVIALQTKHAWPAFVAGALVGVSFLNRPDGYLLVMGSAAAGAAIVVLRRVDRRVLAFAAGLLVVLPYCFWQAYAAAITYSKLNNIPSLKITMGLLVVLAVLAMALRLVIGWLIPIINTLVAKRSVQFGVGSLVFAIVAGLLLLGFFRPRLFGEDYGQFNGKRARTFDEQTLARLSWFFTLPGFAIMAMGIGLIVLRRWRAELWAVAIPVMVIFPIYAFHARNSSRLMWWGRRYIPVVLPGIVIFIAIALGFALAFRGRGRGLFQVPAALAFVALVAVFLQQSLPLRHHDEWHGSFGVTERLSKLAEGKEGIFLWQSSPYCCAAPTSLFATPLWLERDELSVLLPPDPAIHTDYIRAYAKAFPGHPVFIVWTGGVDPPAVSIPPSLIRRVDHIAGNLPIWEESNTERPRRERLIAFEMTIYRVVGT